MPGNCRSRLSPLQPPELLFHFVGSLPGPDDYFANAAHRLTVRGHDRQSPNVVQNIFGRDRFLPNPALGEGDIFRNSRIEVMGDHHHIERLFKRI